MKERPRMEKYGVFSPKYSRNSVLDEIFLPQMITIMAFFPQILGTFFKRKSKNQLIFLGKDLLEKHWINISICYTNSNALQQETKYIFSF